MALSRNVYDPLFPLSSFDRDMDSLLRLANRINVRPNADGTTYQVPNYEYQRDNDNFHLQVELPGVAKEHIDVKINTGNLTIIARRFRPSQAESGSQKPEQSTQVTAENDADVTQSPKPSHVYKMQVEVGSTVDEDAIKADYNHGVLSMVIPLKKISARTIAITEH
ncbi:Small heat shock protein C4 [Gracilariopsis chorda]|uniref:Small heat shock protein C4 n=1 Tax=Gracilariopsis chorda TaxID=448386 RepID=A0A2V3IM19_9FLOR|nr:Small heat shock protein C4 [Gracilariopsis chorda]PXF45332.1 Small heat shock protein C4 [Gracilariopsis chorda]|eukprot:PXF43131.1 Small heat shock protein C4 [Gracilariopsis chorda]